MLESILCLATGISLTDLGALAALTTIIVQVLKQILPKVIPTKIVTIITAIVLSVAAALICFGVMFKTALVGLLMGFIVAFVSMNGFDSLREIWIRFTSGQEIDDDEVGGEG